MPCKTKEKYKIIAHNPFTDAYRPTTTFDNYEDASDYADTLNQNSNGLWYYSVEEI